MASGWRWLAGLLIGTVVSVAAVSAADTLYRYRNAEDIMVIGFSIPPEFAVKGYEIITPMGRVIETVPPASDFSSRDQQNQLREQKRLDAFILRSYTTVQDVHNARDRRLTLLSRELDILKGNIAEYSNRRSQMRKQAASYQASGSELPESIETLLADLLEQEKNTRKMLAEREQQHQELVARYEYYARRLVELKGDTALGTEAGAEGVVRSDEKSPLQEPAIDPARPPLAND
ncbi:MAG: hypothetical protein VR73_13245 [Gammaproteobacteria bacterium BRH_c0]|nr:MAG: hypothetical protein VR73_13245 [Gammaproteobacteria bacterium BRH_c0]